MENLNVLLNSITEKTNIVLGKMDGLKAENLRLQSENKALNEKITELETAIEANAKVINIAPQNYAPASTESIKKTIDGIVSEIDQALAILSN